jgi:hypothetical protein
MSDLGATPGWFEIHQYNDKRSITVANIVEQEWFSRYPRPTQVTYDRGSEFIGHEFRDMWLFMVGQTIPLVKRTVNGYEGEI